MSQAISVINKLTDAVIANMQFTDEQTGKAVNYKRLVIAVEFDGVTEELEFQPSSSQGKLAYRILQLADDVDAK